MGTFQSRVRVGVSGFKYPAWRNVFYPPGLLQKNELSYLANRVDSIELNGSFYSLKRPEDYRRWHHDTPRGFLFSVKGGRYVTHMRRLRDVETPLANFFASGVLCLEEKLGVFLWQFPATLECDGRFEEFFRLLPRDTFAAAELAKNHASWLRGRVAFETRHRRPLRHAVEVRSETCANEAFVELLRRYDIALVVADTASRFLYLEDVTTDFVYVRLHGDKEIYKSGYSNDAIRRWASRVRAWHRGREPPDAHRVGEKASPEPGGRDVFVYFDNDVKVRAPFDAMALRKAVGPR